MVFNKMAIQRHIVAMGGGGFSAEPRNHRLDDFIMGLSRRPRRTRVCFVPTATGDRQTSIDRFYRRLGRRCVASHLNLFAREVVDLKRFLLEQDVIYVGGGNTANMLAVWRLHGVDRILRRAWAEGVVLCGASAGANCWFEACSTDSFGPLAPLNDGLGLLAGSLCPHYHSEVRRQPTFNQWIAEGQLPAGLALDDCVGAHFVGRRFIEVVGSRPGLGAYRVERVGRRSVETPLSVRELS